MRNFREYDIWKNAIRFTADIYKLTASFPSEEKYGLCSQIQRSAVSIAANIAEGASRKSEKDFCRFLEIAIGSAFELETLLIISKEIELINENDFDVLLERLNLQEKQIVSFMSRLK